MFFGAQLKKAAAFLNPVNLILIGPAALAVEPGIEGSVRVRLDGWSAPCFAAESPTRAPRCGLPQPLETASFQQEINLARVNRPGQADRVSQEYSFQSRDGRALLAGRITLFSVYPHEASAQPPYVQIRLEIGSPVRAVCAQSIQWSPPGPLPPLMCAGFEEKGESLVQYGATLQMIAVQASQTR